MPAIVTEPAVKRDARRCGEQTAAGTTLFQALEPHKHHFPAFVLPAIRCGEESGHLDQTLRYLENHCRLLIGHVRTMRDMWLVPLCLMLGGTVICVLAYCVSLPGRRPFSTSSIRWNSTQP